MLQGNWVVRGNVSYLKADGSYFKGNGETCKTSLRREGQPIQQEKQVTSPFSRKTKRKTSFDKADKGLPGRLLVRLLVVQAMEHQNYLKNYFLAYCASHIY